uniref:Similarity. Hypothetical start n=1 Tax=Microcystis aeruginosa (strain PCC 7806) TaxID=267872 RepID=A8YHP3_MICA7|nr:unnamed protein product [Microcystis aeruginosa PCC 7806]
MSLENLTGDSSCGSMYRLNSMVKLTIIFYLNLYNQQNPCYNRQYMVINQFHPLHPHRHPQS